MQVRVLTIAGSDGRRLSGIGALLAFCNGGGVPSPRTWNATRKHFDCGVPPPPRLRWTRRAPRLQISPTRARLRNMTGVKLALGTFAALAAAPFLITAEMAAAPFANPFGLQLRPAPATLAAVRAPVILRAAPTNETCLLRRSDGTLELYGIAKPASDAVTVLRSRDGGLTWSEPGPAFPLPGKAYYALQVLEAADGVLHAVVHVLGEGPGGYRGRLYEVYHVRKDARAAAWWAPQRVVPGYVGSIRGFTPLRSGRIVLAVARAIPERAQAPTAGPDRVRIFVVAPLPDSFRLAGKGLGAERGYVIYIEDKERP